MSTFDKYSLLDPAKMMREIEAADAAIAGEGGDSSDLAIDTTAITGGTTTRLLYDNAGTVGETAGITFTTTGQLAVASGSLTTSSQPALNVTQTWNDGAVGFTGLKLNITDTASDSTAKFLDVQSGGASILSVLKNTTRLGTGLRLQAETPNSQYLEITPRDGNLGAPSIATGGVTIYFDGSLNTVNHSANGFIGAAASIGVPDLILSRAAAATLQQGAADAAAPVAQTLQVQSVSAGTANTAGADWTIAGSKGTGTGAPGLIVFKTAPAGGAGSSQNALATAMTIGSVSAGQEKTVKFASRIGVDNADPGSNGVSITCENSIVAGNGFAILSAEAILGETSAKLRGGGTGYLCLSSSNSVPIILFGADDAAAPIAQTLRVQSVVAGTSNTAGVDFTIGGSKGTGTGAGGSIVFKTAPAGGAGSTQNALATAMIIPSAGIAAYADDAAAATGGVPVGGLYRTASVVKIRVS